MEKTGYYVSWEWPPPPSHRWRVARVVSPVRGESRYPSERPSDLAQHASALQACQDHLPLHGQFLRNFFVRLSRRNTREEPKIIGRGTCE
jgi:hypothetical protein